MGMPPGGRSVEEILAEIEERKADDVRWHDGRAFTLAYHAGDEVLELQRRAYAALSTENALNTDAFPSLRGMQSEVVATVAELLHGGPGASGFMTTGGTESILMACRAAKQRAVAERGITEPEVVLPTTAHAAFEKAADYFGLRNIRVPVGEDWRADVAAMAEAIGPNTALVVGSAPQYPQGVIDPIADIAALASSVDASCHVDACMGGITLPFLERLGEEIPPWDLRVDGVTSISVDLHKYGYAAKGASVVMYRDKGLRRHQTFVTDNWLGGFYGSSGVLGTKSGGAIAAAWAVMQHLGEHGYLRLTAQARRAALAIADGIEAIDGLVLRARPEATLLAFGSHEHGLDTFAIGDALWRRGWYLDRQTPPDSLHCTVNAVHEAVAPEFLADLAASVAEVRAAATIGANQAYGTVE